MAVAADEVLERLRDTEMQVQRTADRIGSHEEICAERYKTINESLSRIMGIMMWFGGALVLGMAGVLVKQLWP